jgi:cytochrome P450
MRKTVDVSASPLAPKSPLPFRRQIAAVRAFHTGTEELRNVGGPVTRVSLGPRWLMPPIVVITSPQGHHDVLGRSGANIDKTRTHAEMRHLIGDNLFDVTHDPWLPRRRALQPVFTKQHVRAFSEHIAEAAEAITQRWSDETTVDIDAECRKLTLRALGHSVLGLDLDEHVDTIAEPLRTVVEYVTDRGLRPVNAPRWLPTPARHEARAARATLRRFANDILQRCRDDPDRDAPLVNALIAATDPATGESLSDSDICNELILFLVAGHDTTATTLAYSLWALGHHADIQDRVRAEVAEIGDRELTPDDVPRLGYTIQVLQEALRLCPPAAILGREAIHDIEVEGYRVSAGTTLLLGIYAMHRDPALWHNPLVFDPERFSPESSKGRDRWQYLPFGGGPRSCIGDHFAMLEATLALATIIRRTEIDSVHGDFPIVVPFTTVAAEPIPARVKLRTRVA